MNVRQTDSNIQGLAMQKKKKTLQDSRKFVTSDEPCLMLPLFS